MVVLSVPVLTAANVIRGCIFGFAWAWLATGANASPRKTLECPEVASPRTM